MVKEEYITKKEFSDAMAERDKKLPEIVREQVMAVETKISNQVHKHITARFDKSHQERHDAHEELKKLIEKSVGDLAKELAPISKMYDTAGTLRKWILAALTFITILVTALANAKAGFKQLIDLIR